MVATDKAASDDPTLKERKIEKKNPHDAILNLPYKGEGGGKRQMHTPRAAINGLYFIWRGRGPQAPDRVYELSAKREARLRGKRMHSHNGMRPHSDRQGNKIKAPRYAIRVNATLVH